MEKNKLKDLLGKELHLPFEKDRDPNAWIFYGWILTVAASSIVLGYTIFFLQSQVLATLKNVDTIFALRERVVYSEINAQLFERVQERWTAKKNLPPPDITRNPFY